MFHCCPPPIAMLIVGNNYCSSTLIEKDHLGDRSPEKDCDRSLEKDCDRSPSQDSYHPDDLFQSRYATPGFKPFSYCKSVL